jgi:phosphatidylglycerophosphate synthase
MTPERRRALISFGALVVGCVLFLVTLYFIDFQLVFAAGRRLAAAFALALVASGLWHLARTWAWAWCFTGPARVPFARLARVRLAAEAFSYLTLRGIAGEPLKVVLLNDEVDAREATAAVALERLAYMIGTTLIVGVGSMIALGTLPLSRTWFRVFRAFAVASGAIAFFTALVLTGRGTYVAGALARIDRAFGTRLGDAGVGRFAIDVERHLLALVRGNPARLAVLISATIAAYACMSAEAWLILRAMDIPISPTGAMAIETFSRVASFASAFIPANLGALEASSLAAVAAVGASAGGAPLALARRLRGIFWAGLGLAIYPRRGRRTPAIPRAAMQESHERRRPILLYLPSDRAVRVSPFSRIAGLPIAERVLRSALRAHYGRVIVLVDEEIEPGMLRLARQIGGKIQCVRASSWTAALGALAPDEAVTAIGAGTVVSPALLEDASHLAVEEGARDVAAGPAWPVTGLLRLHAAAAMHHESVAEQLHARLIAEAPLPSGIDVSREGARLVLRVCDEADLGAAEQTLRLATYKNTDNKLARFNRRISLPISIALIRTPLTANQLSVALVAVGFYSAWLFSLGHYGASVLGAFLSLAASVLDGCDGEIARLKYQESALGCWIETFGDYSYYIAIFVGMTIGAVRFTGLPMFYWFGGAALAGTLVTFALLIFLRTRITGGQPQKLHAVGRERFMAEPSAWSRLIWRVSFCATRSAMPYGIMALTLLGLVPLLVVLAAIGANTYWISLVLKLKHLLGPDDTEPVAA